MENLEEWARDRKTSLYKEVEWNQVHLEEVDRTAACCHRNKYAKLRRNRWILAPTCFVKEVAMEGEGKGEGHRKESAKGLSVTVELAQMIAAIGMVRVCVAMVTVSCVQGTGWQGRDFAPNLKF